MPRVLAAIVAATFGLLSQQSRAATNVLFILDSSGSMLERVDGVPKTVSAKKVMRDTLGALPSEVHAGLMTYGHRRSGDCRDIEVLSPIGVDTPAALAAKVDALKPKGETPIAGALTSAAEVFKPYPKDRNVVVLVTDGAEECHGDPCAAAQALAAANVDLHLNVVGFKLQDKERRAVECIAREGHGRYYDASDTKALVAAMQEVRTELAQATPPPAPVAPAPSPNANNLLLAANGGQVIIAQDETWRTSINGNDDAVVGFMCNRLPIDVVYAFKDEKPATFSKFSILIPYTGKFVKDFELMAADDSPTGTYRSLGTFTTQNMRMLKTPYQEFSFPETTARYLKLRILSVHPSDCSQSLTQVRLTGTLSADAAPAAAPAASNDTNVLLTANGGQVIMAPGSGWEAPISGNEGASREFACNPLPVEVVYAFKDERLAKVSSFSILMPYRGQLVKDFELLAADNSPTGDYRSLGKFTTVNARMLKSPYQAFGFPETTARYLKVRLLSGWEGDCRLWLTQIRLMGALLPASTAPAAPAAAPAGINLLLEANGGQVIASPDSTWKASINGNDSSGVGFMCNNLPIEAVYAFKDERAATFSKFAMLIPYAGKFVKDFELLAADDSPVGNYRSLGKFATQYAFMIKSPYQEFSFPETTAKYLKLRILSGHPTGDCTQTLTQIRLIGSLAEQPKAAAAASNASKDINVLLAANGGQLLAAPDATWENVISGNDAQGVGFMCNNLPIEAIYAFKDEKPATFSKFSMLIPYAGKFVKDFELLVADDSPTGTYRSLGKFATQYTLMTKTPYQEFSFPETTARYLKLRILSGHPTGDCTQTLTQIRLMGHPAS